MTDTTIISKLAKNEELLSKLYQTYAARFPELAGFWSKMADEENRHAEWLQKFDAAVQDGKMYLRPFRFNTEAVENVTAQATAALAAAQEPSCRMADALAATLKFEEMIIERRFFQTVNTDTLELMQTFSIVEQETQTHLNRARELCEKYKKK
jgi:hypothetical protein